MRYPRAGQHNYPPELPKQSLEAPWGWAEAFSSDILMKFCSMVYLHQGYIAVVYESGYLTRSLEGRFKTK